MKTNTQKNKIRIMKSRAIKERQRPVKRFTRTERGSSDGASQGTSSCPKGRADEQKTDYSVYKETSFKNSGSALASLSVG